VDHRTNLNSVEKRDLVLRPGIKLWFLSHPDYALINLNFGIYLMYLVIISVNLPICGSTSSSLRLQYHFIFGHYMYFDIKNIWKFERLIVVSCGKLKYSSMIFIMHHGVVSSVQNLTLLDLKFPSVC
jgi:hypothetical protein